MKVFIWTSRVNCALCVFHVRSTCCQVESLWNHQTVTSGEPKHVWSLDESVRGINGEENTSSLLEAKMRLQKQNLQQETLSTIFKGSGFLASRRTGKKKRRT